MKYLCEILKDLALKGITSSTLLTLNLAVKVKKIIVKYDKSDLMYYNNSYPILPDVLYLEYKDIPNIQDVLKLVNYDLKTFEFGCNYKLMCGCGLMSIFSVNEGLKFSINIDTQRYITDTLILYLPDTLKELRCNFKGISKNYISKFKILKKLSCKNCGFLPSGKFSSN